MHRTQSKVQVFFSYALITPTECSLYIREESLNDSVKAYLEENKVVVKSYTSIWDDLASLGKTVEQALAEGTSKPSDKTADKTQDILRKIEGCGGKVMVGSHTSWAVALAMGEVSCALNAR